MTLVTVNLVRQVEVSVQARGAQGIPGPAGGIPAYAQDPVSPTDGLVYYNTTSGTLRFYTNAEGWRAVLEVENGATAEQGDKADNAVQLTGETAQDIEGSLAVSGGLSVGYGQQIQAYGPGGFVTGGPLEAASANIQGPVEAYRADVRDGVTVDGDPVLTAQQLKTLVAASTDFADFKIRVATQL